jgi:predicted nucleotidyltransferase
MQLLSNVRNGKLPVGAVMLFGSLRRHKLSTTKSDISIKSNVRSMRQSWQHKLEKKKNYAT